MNRTEVLRGAMLANQHPLYGVLSYGKHMRIQEACAKLAPEGNRTLENQIAWVMCILDHDDPTISELFDSESPAKAIADYCESRLHISEMMRFDKWYGAEMNATEAAITKPKEETGPGKSEGSELAEANLTS